MYAQQPIFILASSKPAGTEVYDVYLAVYLSKTTDIWLSWRVKMKRLLTTLDISWFLDLKDKDQLDLNPPYQRRSVWSVSDKRFFIDTILNNYPAPPIFLHKELNEQGRAVFHVVDGRQRLETIFGFMDGEIKIPLDFSDPSLQGKDWNDLSSELRHNYWNYELIVEMLPVVEDDRLLRDIFERINRNSRKLTPQEMRHAKYDGWFISVVEEEAKKKEWEDFKIATVRKSKRMQDIQFISELYAVILRNEMSSFKQPDMDKLYAEFDVIDDSDFIHESCSKFEQIKSIIGNIYKLQPSVSKHLKFNVHFYTLWSYLYFNCESLPREEDFISRYMNFMREVSEWKNLDSDDSDNKSKNTDNYTFPKDVIDDYSSNIKGANTDLRPRQKRLDALTKALAQKES